MYWWHDLKALFHELGPARATFALITVLVPTFAYMGSIYWLSEQIGWPEAYGFQCRRKCLFTYIWHSPALLADPSPASFALFALLSLLPGLLVLGLIIWGRRKFKAWRQRIRPMKD